MIVIISFIMFLYSSLFIFVPSIFSDIKINEVLIDPEQAVELLNTSTDEVDLSSWYIDDSGGTTYYTIPHNTIIQPGSCLVFSANFNFNKVSNDTVRLFDNTYPPTSTLSALIDYFSYLKSPAGNISFIRSPDAHGEWTTASSSLNFFNSIEETCLFIQSIIPSPTLTQIPSSQNDKSTESIKYIYISEVMVAPNTGEKEWVEIYNDNAYDVNLKDWFIDDIAEGGSTQKKFSLTLQAYSYMIVELNSSIFNNDGDDVRLLDSSNNLIDIFSYDFSEKGKTFGRIDFSNLEYCLQEPSKAQINSSCLDENQNNEDQNISEAEGSDLSNLETYTPKVTESKNIIDQPINYIQNEITTPPNVLGASTISYNSNQQKSSKPLAPLALMSTGYSLLTLLSISLKIKEVI